MTSFVDAGPFIPPESVESWFDSVGIELPSDVFDWDTDMIVEKYEKLWNIVDNANKEIGILDSLFKIHHKERMDYMQKNGLEGWNLEPEQSMIHTQFKKEIFAKIEKISEQKAEYKQIIRQNYSTLKLCHGILDGTCGSFTSIVSQLKRTHGMTSTNNFNGQWDGAGPFGNPYWSMYPKLKEPYKRDNFPDIDFGDVFLRDFYKN